MNREIVKDSGIPSEVLTDDFEKPPLVDVNSTNCWKQPEQLTQWEAEESILLGGYALNMRTFSAVKQEEPTCN